MCHRPRRTRTSSGSIVRIFRGEFVGTVGGTLSSQGLDRRILIKEFSDSDLAMSLVKSELQSIGRLQSNLMFPSIDESAKMNGIEWIRTAMARRSTDLRKDCANVAALLKALAGAPYVGILGRLIVCCCGYRIYVYGTNNLITFPPPNRRGRLIGA